MNKDEIAMFGLGLQELMVVLWFAFFIFEAKRSPFLRSGLGQDS